MKFKFLFVICFLITRLAGAQSETDTVNTEDAASATTKIEVEQSEVQPKDEEASKLKGVERIEVTGSYVKRIDVEGPSPMVTINKEDFEEAGVDTVSDYLKESPLFGGSQDSGNRDGYFRFRGQHAGSTLVLINGMRVPKLGGPDRGFYSGVENIPTNIIERVEILKDGSSALYGSDAMAGVMNFITKKDYDGAEYSTRINVPEIGAGLQQNHTLAFGKSYNKGSWFASAQFVEQRGYTQADVGNFIQGPDARAGTTGNFSTFRANGEEVNDTRIQQPCSAERCETDFRGVDYVREPRQNIGTMVSGRIDLSSDMSFAMTGMYNRRRRMDLGRPQYINVSEEDNGLKIPINELGSSSLKNKNAGASFAEFGVMPFDEVGAQQIEVIQNSYSAQMKLEKFFADTWRWDFSSSYAYSLEERDHMNGLVSEAGVRQALAGGWDPTNTGGSNVGILNNARVQGTEAYEASLATARFLAAGEMFDMSDIYGAGGPVSIAFGVEGQYETTNDAHDEILIQQSFNQDFFPNQEGSRAVNSVFAELVSYPLESLEFQAAGRYDGYSDFGGTFNPKFSVGYRPSNKMLIRSSWGTNFNAPAVRNMIMQDTQDRIDVEFNDARNEENVPVTYYRDPDLGPESGVNYNLGTVIQPNKMWTFTIDQWNFEGKNTITRFYGSDYSDIYANLGGGAQAEQQMRDQFGVEIERNADDTVRSMRAPFVVNMGERTIRGLDVNIAFRNPIRLFGRVFKFRSGFDHTQFLVHRTKQADALPFEFRADMEWKNTLSFNLATQDHNYRLAARTVAGDTNWEQTRTHTEYDFNYGWNLPWWQASVSLGVKNLLNSRPPVARDDRLVNFASGRNAYAFNALGRRYYVGYSHSF